MVQRPQRRSDQTAPGTQFQLHLFSGQAASSGGTSARLVGKCGQVQQWACQQALLQGEKPGIEERHTLTKASDLSELGTVTIDVREVAMSSNKREPSKDPGSEIVLGPRDSLVGLLSIEGNLRVQGVAQGELRVNGDIRIDESASVTASIDGRNVSIRGRVTGNVTARERLLLAGSGVIGGDVRTARLVVEGRATLNGNVSMGAAGEVTQEDAPQNQQPEAALLGSGSEVDKPG